MRTLIVGIVFVVSALCAGRATADPVAVTGFLTGQPRGALIQEELELSFPEFTILLSDVTHLIPGFCDECGNGSPVRFTQTTGTFSGHSIGDPGLRTIDADVTGELSFEGPADVISIAPEQFASDVLSESVQISGRLRVTQANRVLFSGMLAGSGLANAVYANRFSAFSTRLEGYQYDINGVATTPEPTSIALLATGIAWLGARQRFTSFRRTRPRRKKQLTVA